MQAERRCDDFVERDLKLLKVILEFEFEYLMNL